MTQPMIFNFSNHTVNKSTFMTSGSNNPKRPNERSLAKSLGALFALTGGLMLSSASAANAAAANSGSAKAGRSRTTGDSGSKDSGATRSRSGNGSQPGRSSSAERPANVVGQIGTTGTRVGVGTIGIPAGAMVVGVTVAGVMAAGTTGTIGTTGATGRRSPSGIAGERRRHYSVQSNGNDNAQMSQTDPLWIERCRMIRSVRGSVCWSFSHRRFVTLTATIAISRIALRRNGCLWRLSPRPLRKSSLPTWFRVR